MTIPPSGPWPPPPPGPGQQPPSWGRQPPWEPPPQRGGNRGKWILGGIALVVVIGLTVVATLLVTRDDSGSGEPTASAPPPAASTSVDPSEFASADDDGPIEIITDEPTCPAWTPIGDTLAQTAAQGWNARDPSIPATKWTQSQRMQYREMADAMRSAAEETVALVKLTPHRVVRELYEQSIAYWRAFADKMPTYTPDDNHIAQVAASTSNAVNYICAAIYYGAAASRAPFVVPSSPPRNIPAVSDTGALPLYGSQPISVCGQWIALVDEFNAATAEWRNTDPSIPAAQWSSEQQQLYVQMNTIMQSNADQMQDLGLRSGNVVFDDFAALAAQYRRAFVQSFVTYQPADAYLANAAGQLVAANYEACSAA